LKVQKKKRISPIRKKKKNKRSEMEKMEAYRSSPREVKK